MREMPYLKVIIQAGSFEDFQKLQATLYHETVAAVYDRRMSGMSAVIDRRNS
jgi:hypothetical protein